MSREGVIYLYAPNHVPPLYSHPSHQRESQISSFGHEEGRGSVQAVSERSNSVVEESRSQTLRTTFKTSLILSDYQAPLMTLSENYQSDTNDLFLRRAKATHDASEMGKASIGVSRFLFP